MLEFLAAYAYLIVAVIILVIGYFFGSRAEKKHYQSIVEREKQFAHIITVNSKYPPDNATIIDTGMGNIVVASDPFKRFVAWLIGIFGGNMTVYESLLDRARREAILRLKMQADALGANMIVNLRFETATINAGSKNSAAAMMEVLAYGTCVSYQPQ